MIKKNDMKSKVLYMAFAIYAVLFFGGNAVRSFFGGQIFIGCALMVGSLAGVVMACHVKDEADREKAERRRETERQLRRMNGKEGGAC